jgi:hypothetical protein
MGVRLVVGEIKVSGDVMIEAIGYRRIEDNGEVMMMTKSFTRSQVNSKS